ncbi:MAG: hypothetical protein FWJ85_13645 [Solitalea sp.]
MDISGNKPPKNPASIRSDEAGSPDKSIYQGKGDAQPMVPADEDRDAQPFSSNREPEQSHDPDREDHRQETDRADRREQKEKPKDDVHSAPESGDKLP